MRAIKPPDGLLVRLPVLANRFRQILSLNPAVTLCQELGEGVRVSLPRELPLLSPYLDWSLVLAKLESTSSGLGNMFTPADGESPVLLSQISDHTPQYQESAYMISVEHEAGLLLIFQT